MKGIVFTEFLEMVEQKFSADMVDDILDGCELASGGIYTAVGTYDHGEIVQMVLKLAELSQIEVPVLINTFGQHLFGRFYQLYPLFFDGITNAIDFISRIEDVIHREVRKLYPDAELPRFETERQTADELVVIYRSPRHFGDLAEGLMQACISHFGQPILLTRQDLNDQADQPVRFIMQRVN
jgi:hypothetical protein